MASADRRTQLIRARSARKRSCSHRARLSRCRRPNELRVGRILSALLTTCAGAKPKFILSHASKTRAAGDFQEPKVWKVGDSDSSHLYHSCGVACRT